MDFPTRILEDIQKGVRGLELMLWFRNRCVRDYLRAMEEKVSGKIAVLDTFWETCPVYIDTWLPDQFEADVIQDLSRMDFESFPWPDLVIALSSSEERLREFARAGGREFERDENIIRLHAALNRAHENYFRNLDRNDILFVDRSKVDYNQPAEIDNLIRTVKEKLDI